MYLFYFYSLWNKNSFQLFCFSPPFELYGDRQHNSSTKCLYLHVAGSENDQCASCYHNTGSTTSAAKQAAAASAPCGGAQKHFAINNRLKITVVTMETASGSPTYSTLITHHRHSAVLLSRRHAKYDGTSISKYLAYGAYWKCVGVCVSFIFSTAGIIVVPTHLSFSVRTLCVHVVVVVVCWCYARAHFVSQCSRFLTYLDLRNSRLYKSALNNCTNSL